jgi:type IV secretory pathway VirB4 component
MDRIIRSKSDFDIAMHITPSSIDSMLVSLNRLLKKLNADKYSAEKKGVYTPSIDLLISDTRKILEEIQAGNEKLFKTSFYLNVKAFDKKKLDSATRQAESILNSLMIIPKKSAFRMREGLQSMMPLAQDKLKQQRTLTTSALSACFPFTSSFLETDKNGVMLATNLSNGIPIIRDVFKLTNPNSLVLGTSGSGKSFCCKLIFLRAFMAGSRVFVIDPQAEYLELTKALEGEVIEISKESKSIINLFDLMNQSFDDKRLSLLSAYKIMFPKIDNLSLSLLDKATTIAYSNCGIKSKEPETWKNKPPIMKDLLNAVKECEEKESKVLSAQIEQYVSGSYSFLNKRTNIDFEKNFTCFDIQKMPSAIKPLMSYLVLEYLYSTMQKNKSRKILAVDEAWSLLSHSDSSDYLFKIVKTCRKFNMSLFLITQEVNDVLNNEAGKSVLANTSCKYLLKQDASVIDDLSKAMGLTDEERGILLRSKVGEGIMIIDSERFPVKIIASPRETELITTNADELNRRENEGQDRCKKRRSKC